MNGDQREWLFTTLVVYAVGVVLVLTGHVLGLYGVLRFRAPVSGGSSLDDTSAEMPVPVFGVLVGLVLVALVGGMWVRRPHSEPVLEGSANGANLSGSDTEPTGTVWQRLKKLAVETVATLTLALLAVPALMVVDAGLFGSFLVVGHAMMCGGVYGRYAVGEAEGERRPAERLYG